jgi:hypothetical protein|tara:strand:- start:1986 stop:2642 length:657 start_codon:yes stop_codon:yes gene_type:complete
MSMLIKTKFSTPIDDINSVIGDVFDKGKHDISNPTGNFFYDPWQLKSEYLGTPWETILNSLPGDKGQARVIILESPSCYTAHSDIDDRYHLNLFGDEAYLIDLEEQKMYKTIKDGIWYDMDAGKIHTAMSIGEHVRAQLVVRKLLNKNKLQNPVTVKVYGNDNPRYKFDNVLSPWLNCANKKGTITNVSIVKFGIQFDIEENLISTIPIPEKMKVEIL